MWWWWTETAINLFCTPSSWPALFLFFLNPQETISASLALSHRVSLNLLRLKPKSKPTLCLKEMLAAHSNPKYWPWLNLLMTVFCTTQKPSKICWMAIFQIYTLTRLGCHMLPFTRFTARTMPWVKSASDPKKQWFTPRSRSISFLRVSAKQVMCWCKTLKRIT